MSTTYCPKCRCYIRAADCPYCGWEEHPATRVFWLLLCLVAALALSPLVCLEPAPADTPSLEKSPNPAYLQDRRDNNLFSGQTMPTSPFWASDKTWVCPNHLFQMRYPASFEHCTIASCGAARPLREQPDNPSPQPPVQDAQWLWERLPRERQEELRQTSSTHATYCSGCGQVIWRRRYEIAKGGTLFCGPHGCALQPSLGRAA